VTSDPTNSVKALKENSVLRIRLQSLDRWLSDLLGSKVKRKLLEVEVTWPAVPQCHTAGDSTARATVSACKYVPDFV